VALVAAGLAAAEVGIEVVGAATMAPVSSKLHSLRVMADRITASCHSKGKWSRPTRCLQYSVVSSRYSPATRAGGPLRPSSGPSTKVSGRSSRVQASSRR
jgi:hypothetical protein